MVKQRVWTGAVNFVLVSIPVEMVPAVHEDRIAFRLLHKKDDALLRRQMYCPADDRFVPWAQISNGYEVGPNRYVIVTPDEYEALEPRRSQTIAIDSFVDFAALDPVYFDRPYYLVPREGGERSYRLLTEVLQDTHKAGLARFVLHDREHPVALWAQSDALVVMLLHFAEQVADRETLHPQEAKAQHAKVGALAALMHRMKAEYNPAHYANEQRERVIGFLQEKARQQGTVATAEPAGAEEQPVQQEEGQDLVAALEESLARARRK